jgi:diguanylate cyclase
MIPQRDRTLFAPDSLAKALSLRTALASLERMRLASELPQALADGSLRLGYQPIVRLGDGVVMGFEALVRWPHPVRGMVPLKELNLIAEETGLSPRLTAWVMAESCRRFGEWIALYRRCAPELALHLNLSGSCLADPGLVGQLQAALAAHGIPASRLVIEISESLLADGSYTSCLLDEIRALGVRVAFDDFGTSSKSLSDLEEAPVDMIKLDPSLVDRLVDQADLEMLDAVVNLAGRLGIAVVAEGVSTEPQLALLCGLGCKLAQGVLFAGPCDDDEVRALVGGERPWDALIAESGSSQDWCLAVTPSKGSSEGDGSLDDWLLAACRSLW